MKLLVLILSHLLSFILKGNTDYVDKVRGKILQGFKNLEELNITMIK